MSETTTADLEIGQHIPEKQRIFLGQWTPKNGEGHPEKSRVFNLYAGLENLTEDGGPLCLQWDDKDTIPALALTSEKLHAVACNGTHEKLEKGFVPDAGIVRDYIVPLVEGVSLNRLRLRHNFAPYSKGDGAHCILAAPNDDSALSVSFNLVDGTPALMRPNSEEDKAAVRIVYAELVSE